MTHWQLKRAFPARTLETIESVIAESERSHGGQICFAVETALPTAALLAGQTARERALEVFSRLRVWDTEHNNGVLIYVLLADRDVEILADRGVHAKTSAGTWEGICHLMEEAFRHRHYEAGAIEGIRAISDLLMEHFSANDARINELPDRPVLL